MLGQPRHALLATFPVCLSLFRFLLHFLDVFPSSFRESSGDSSEATPRRHAHIPAHVVFTAPQTSFSFAISGEGGGASRLPCI